ncbi:hypothetical protein CLOM_g9932 [Closterium sp. NIES-68]|nr:hypothetical protein CLOM_g9932 [Closterium sp. NIES-68]GJP68470.1 hypothetical protein CLOP_g25176 [Closterium sp. NIES-67]
MTTATARLCLAPVHLEASAKEHSAPRFQIISSIGSLKRFEGLRCHGATARAQPARVTVVQRRLKGTVSATATSADAPAAVSSSFIGVKTEEEMMDAITKEAARFRLPERVVLGMRDFYHSYANAVASSGIENAEQLSLQIMSTVFDVIMGQIMKPHAFESHHLAVREPFDYYAFGQNYVRPLINYSKSFIGNVKIFDEIQANLDAGHNVILMTNHQTEADPGVIALMLESSHPRLATSITYVAGDRVVFDPFCMPFSLGRNLLCVHSKKHLNDEPELAEQKRAENRRTLKVMGKLFKEGGNFVWIAPSGGRDRISPDSNYVPPAAFDSSAVGLMRRLTSESGVPSHLHPTALYSYDIMPPPRTLEKELGEKRVIGFHGVAFSVGEEIDFDAVTAGIEDRREAQEKYSDALFASVVEQYDLLVQAVQEKGLDASTDKVKLEQTWL